MKRLRTILCAAGTLCVIIPLTMARLGVLTFDGTASGIILLTALGFFIAATATKIADCRGEGELYRPLIGVLVGLGLVFLGKLFSLLFG